MGTRNITKVYLNNEQVVDQYCQWDGYPTGHGKNVMEFVKKYCSGKSLEEFKRRLEKSTLMIAKAGVACSTGARPNPILYKIDRLIFDKGSNSIKWKELLEEGELTKRDLSYYKAASRDTGSDILYWLMEAEPDGMEFYSTDYTYNMKIELDWQIEGMYVIDLDNEKVIIDWHGKMKVYSFKDVKKMSNEEIQAEMEAFEMGDSD